MSKFGRNTLIVVAIHFIGVAAWWAWYDKHYACNDYKAANWSAVQCMGQAVAGVWEFGVVELAIRKVIP